MIFAVRHMERHDVAAVTELWGELMGTASEVEPMYRLRRGAQRTFADYLSHQFNRHNAVPPGLIAHKEDQLLGFILLAPSPAHFLLDQPALLQINDLWVHPDHRRRGVARALVSEAFVSAKKAKLELTSLTTLFKDERARAFWSAMGFEQVTVRLMKRL